MICFLQAGSQRKPVMWFSSKPKGLRTGAKVKPLSGPTAWEPGALMFKGMRQWMSRPGREHIFPFSAFLFYSGPQWFGWCLTTVVRVIFSTQSTDSYANIFQKHPPEAPRENVLFFFLISRNSLTVRTGEFCEHWSDQYQGQQISWCFTHCRI